jgi:hypothetical protein
MVENIKVIAVSGAWEVTMTLLKPDTPAQYIRAEERVMMRDFNNTEDYSKEMDCSVRNNKYLT